MLSNAVKLLEAKPDFIKWQGEPWRQESRAAKLRWLRQHVRAIPLEKAYLLRFVAATANPQQAAAIANATAAAYCEWRNAPEAMSAGVAGPLNAEIMDAAASAIGPEANSNPVAEGLLGALGDVGLLVVGAGIGYLGFLVEKARRECQQRTSSSSTRKTQVST